MVEDVVDSANIEDCDSMSPCDSEPCENEGIYLDIGNGTFACSCQEGFRGDTCEDMDTICDILEWCSLLWEHLSLCVSVSLGSRWAGL